MALPTTQLQPGAKGPDVVALQQWLIQNGYSIPSGATGNYGPETTAAVAKLQQHLGVNNSSGPGYYGPQTIAAVQSGYGLMGGMSTPGGPVQVSYAPQSTPGGVVQAPTYTPFPTATTTTPSGASGGASIFGAPKGSTGNTATTKVSSGGAIGSNLTSTGDPSLDSALSSLSSLANNLVTNGYTIPPNLQITPDLVSKFLTMAHAVVDPATQQTLNAKITDINADLKNQQAQYEAQQGGIVQDFGTNLATEQNTAGNSGTAFSGMRGLTERNLETSTNRSLASLGSATAYNAGNTLRSGAAAVGSANAGSFTLPSILGGTVSAAGGSRGTFTPGEKADLSYDPSIYKVGSIPSEGNVNVQTQAKNYLDQYQTLASNSSGSGRSMNDLVGSLSGLPSSSTYSGPAPTVTTTPLNTNSPSTTPASNSAPSAPTTADPYTLGQVFQSSKPMNSAGNLFGTFTYKGNGQWGVSDNVHGNWDVSMPTAQVQSYGLT